MERFAGGLVAAGRHRPHWRRLDHSAAPRFAAAGVTDSSASATRSLQRRSAAWPESRPHPLRFRSPGPELRGQRRHSDRYHLPPRPQPELPGRHLGRNFSVNRYSDRSSIHGSGARNAILASRTCVAGAVSTSGLARAGRHDAPGTVTPDTVAAAAPARLGHGPRVVPGAFMRLSTTLMAELLPRRSAIDLMARATKRVLRGAGGHDGPP
jgi:hypothetical protein